MTINKRQLNALMTDFIVRSLELRADRVRENHEANARGIARLYQAIERGTSVVDSGVATKLGGVSMDFGNLEELRKTLAEDEERASMQLETIARCEDAIKRLQTAGSRLTKENQRVILQTVEQRKKRALHMIDGFRRVTASLERDLKTATTDRQAIEENLLRHRRILNKRDEIILLANEIIGLSLK